LSDGTQAGYYTTTLRQVINETDAYFQTPFIYPTGSPNIQPVKSISVATASVTYTPLLNSYFVTNANGGILQESQAVITVDNLESFCGNVDRIKIFRKSLSKNTDYEILCDTKIIPTEELIDLSSENKQIDRVGFFYSASVLNYWSSSFGASSLSVSNQNIIAGMQLGGAFDASGNNTVTTSGSYLNLFANVEYVFSCTVHTARQNTGTQANVEFYITDTSIDHSTSPQFDGYGILIANTSFSAGTNNTFYDISTTFTLNKDTTGSFSIVPLCDGFTVSDISVIANSAFSVSPGVYRVTVDYPVDFAGERGMDVGGLTRDFFIELSKEMFNPNYSLFTKSANGSTYMPN
jgi:hypothetical protein